MKLLGKFMKLTPGERRLLATAWLYLVATRAVLTLLPFPSVLKWSSRYTVVPHPAAERKASSFTAAERIPWAIQAASRYVPRGSNCLVQAIATQAMLARRGHSAHLRIGAAKDSGTQFKAHAWVEWNGRIVVGGPGVSEFTAFPPLEPQR